MKRTMFRAAVLGLSSSVVAALAVAGATPASAAPNQYAPSIGTVVGTSLTGPTNVPVSIRGSVACPAGTTVINGFLNSTAANIVDGIAISTNSTDVDSLTTTGVPLDNNLLGIAQSAGRVLVNGTYELSVVCYPDAFSSPTAQLDGVFTVSGGADASSPGTTYTWQTPAAPSSTTVLNVTPAGGANIGDNVTLTATVTSSAPVAGTVNFRNGATTIGTGTVSGGTASFSTTSLPGGTLSLSAEFVPTDPNVVAGSTSAPVSYTITAPAQATTTTLSSSPANPTTSDVVSLTATVTPSAATGQVVFQEGATTVGTANVAGGTASISLVGLSAGSHTYTASFTPNTSAYLASTAAAYSITVSTSTTPTATENITTVVAAGTLTITAGGTVNLGTLGLNASNSLLVTAAPVDINTVTVTDTRSGNLGWNVNGVVTDFANATGGQINSENLGWTPRVVSQQPTQSVTAGAVVAPGSGVAVGATTGAGLKTSRLLASAATGGSLGTAELTAALVLQAPTSTTAGVYNATLTLTAV